MADAPHPVVVASQDQSEAVGRQFASNVIGYYRRWMEAGFTEAQAELWTANYQDGLLGICPVTPDEDEDEGDEA